MTASKNPNDKLIRRVRLGAFASCAWQDAVDPVHAASLRALFDGGDAATFEEVERRLGPEAAQAWQAAIDARERFFNASKQ